MCENCPEDLTSPGVPSWTQCCGAVSSRGGGHVRAVASHFGAMCAHACVVNVG